MAFRTGQKVVALYVRATWGEWWNQVRHPSRYAYPVVGHIYTISNVYLSENDLMLELSEIHAPQEEHWCAGFYATHFRPVVTRKTDISVFTKLLKPAPARQMALTAPNREGEP